VATLVLTIERPGRPAETATFDAEELFVGRRDGVDIPIPDTNVSRRHARIFRRGDAWFVEDLASRNGTKLNGVPVSGPAPFAAGDTVRIGDATLRMPAPEGSAPRPGPFASASDEHLTTFSVIKPAASLIEASGDAC
jgi:nitrite reductase (NADH) large subunit